jgi:hypothetical protein
MYPFLDPDDPNRIFKELEKWVQDYKNDEPPVSLAQTAAIQAMDHFLDSWKNGLQPGDLKVCLNETSRMLQILNAFQGKLAILDCIVNGLPEDED